MAESDGLNRVGGANDEVVASDVGKALVVSWDCGERRCVLCYPHDLRGHSVCGRV